MKALETGAEKIRGPGFTLIEFLLILALFLILAFLLFPANPPGRCGHTKIGQSKLEMMQLSASIKAYESTYTHLPTGTNLAAASDITFGPFAEGYIEYHSERMFQVTDNSEIISILMNKAAIHGNQSSKIENNPLNPQNLIFLNQKLVADNKSPGVGPDGVYRDPWGNPYIITLDTDGDGWCRDAFYSRPSVSAGQNNKSIIVGLEKRPSGCFEFQGRTMIWSFGPDGKADPNKKADQGFNKDNVVCW